MFFNRNRRIGQIKCVQYNTFYWPSSSLALALEIYFHYTLTLWRYNNSITHALIVRKRPGHLSLSVVSESWRKKAALKKKVCSFRSCNFVKSRLWHKHWPSDLFKLWSSHLEMFFATGVPNSFSIFTGKRLCWSLILIKLHVWRPTTLFKQRLHHRCFLVSIPKFLRIIVL